MPDTARFIPAPGVERVSTVDVSPTGEVAIGGDGDRPVALLAGMEGAPEYPTTTRLREVRRLRYCRDGSIVLASPTTGFWRVWRDPDLHAMPWWVPPGLWVDARPDGDLVVLSGSEGEVSGDPKGRPVARFPGARVVRPWGRIPTLAVLLPGEREMIEVEPGGPAWRRELATGRREPACERPNEVARVVDRTADGQWFAIAGLLGRGGGVWSVSTGEPRPILDPLAGSAIVALRFSPGGARLAVGGASGFVEVFEVPSGKPVVGAIVGRSRVEDLAWASERSLAAATGQGGLWWMDVPS